MVPIIQLHCVQRVAALFVEFNSQVQNSKNTHLDSITRLKKMLSFRCFLDLLSDRDNFGYNTFEEYYPGLRQKVIGLTCHLINLLKPELAMCKQWIQNCQFVFQ